jgi:HEAT repeat protein
MFRRRIPRPWAVLGAGLVLVASLTACVEDSAERITSIYELKAVPSEANLNRIRSLLDDPDRDVRATALNALVTLEVPDSARLARAGLEDADAFVRATAAKLLGDVGDRAQVEPLVSRLLEDPDPIVRQRAAESLGRLGGEAAASGLARGLEDPVGSVRLAAVRGVRALDPGMALPALARLLLEDPDWEVRVQDPTMPCAGRRSIIRDGGSCASPPGDSPCVRRRARRSGPCRTDPVGRSRARRCSTAGA